MCVCARMRLRVRAHEVVCVCACDCVCARHGCTCVQEAADRETRLAQLRAAADTATRASCKQYVDPSHAPRPSTPDRALTPVTRQGVRLYDSGQRAKAALAAKVALAKGQRALRIDDWVCPVCAGHNAGDAPSCQTIVKTGGEVCARVCVCEPCV